ncbi:hypothetical protein Fcan01_15718 [Folsomia candida]|uniref:Uncharacterized protein n=1 Tax=Folsomia candida TaxID=158441 RepID=A0A226DWV8_FOLCA|nr:hypothetical protein Fcan01_15718 [Folsomia candida]
MCTSSTSPERDSKEDEQRLVHLVILFCAIWICSAITAIACHFLLTSIHLEERSGKWVAPIGWRYDQGFPPSGDSNATGVTPYFTGGPSGLDLGLNFVLVQTWKDDRLMVNSDPENVCPHNPYCPDYPDYPQNPVKNKATIRGKNGEQISIWKPSIATDPTSSSNVIGDESWLHGDGRVYRTRHINLILPLSLHANFTPLANDYFLDIFSNREFLDGVTLEWKGEDPVSFKGDEEEAARRRKSGTYTAPSPSLVISSDSARWRVGYSVGKSSEWSLRSRGLFLSRG